MSNRVINVEAFGQSNIGYAKEDNEDALYISPDNRVLAVADGIGGEPFGEVASALAIQAISELFQTDPPSATSDDEHAEWVERAFDFANEKIYRHAERHTQTYGMGTTLVVAVATTNGATIGNVGDSRALLIEGKFARTITRDHVAEPDPGKRHHKSARKGGLTRRLGNDFSVTTDIYTIGITNGSWLVLCTDGLHGVVSLDDIASLSSTANTAEEYCDALIESALEQGGPDNVTVVAWRWTDTTFSTSNQI